MRELYVRRYFSKTEKARREYARSLVHVREARAANKARDEFLAHMGHERGTPLNAILGSSDVIKGELLGPLGSGRYEGYVDDIRASGSHLLAIANDILDVAQASAGQTPINKFIRTSVNANASTANQAYVPNYYNSQVANPQDNLYFTLNAQQAILVERYGVRGPAAPNSTGYDLLSAWIQVPNQTPTQAPAGGIPAAYQLNEAFYGVLPSQTNQFAGVPLLPQGQLLLWNEAAYATWVDNGTSIPAGDVRQAFVGTLFGTNAEGV